MPLLKRKSDTEEYKQKKCMICQRPVYQYHEILRHGKIKMRLCLKCYNKYREMRGDDL